METSPVDERLPEAPLSAAPADIGATLREAREQRSLSLEQLSRTTKIGVTTLRNIENNQIEKLPDRVFLRGFVSAYAREVGLDPGDTVRRYLAQFEAEGPLTETPVATSS